MVRRLRVVHVDHSTGRGGAEYSLARVLAHARQGWDPVLALPRGGESLGPFDGLRQTRALSIVRVGPAQDAGASTARSAAHLARFTVGIVSQAIALRFHRAFREGDIVHANTSRAGIYAALACVGTRKRLVVHLRDMVDAQALGRVGEIGFRRLVLRRASGVIANSYATLATATPHIAATTLTRVIPSAAGLTPRRRAAEQPPQIRRVGMVARIDPWKGQELLLEAFSDVFAGTSVRLALAGAPEFGKEDYLARLRSVAEHLGIKDQVDFLGHVEDVEGFIDSLDLCVQASLRPEPLGQNVLQYLAAGKPTIAADAGGPMEWISSGANGLLFSMGERESLAQALAQLRSQSVRARLAEEASRTPGLLDDRAVAEAHAAFYTEVYRRPGRR